MVVVDVQANGQAPAGLSTGDYVRTAGGYYMIADPGTFGAEYSPASGYWSIKNGTSPNSVVNDINSPAAFAQILASARELADYNSQQSQKNAETMMNFQRQANAEAMDFNSREAQLTRDWQEKMSNTAHQREIADLIAAGLNPVLSAKLGGASTPSGATASGVTSSGAMGSVDTSGNSVLGSIFNSLLSAAVIDATNKNNLDIAKLQAATNIYGYDTSFASAANVANINAQSQWNLLQKKNEFEEYLRKHYPNTTAGIISQGTDAFWNLLNTDFNSGNTVSDSIGGLLRAFRLLEGSYEGWSNQDPDPTNHHQ